MSLLVVLLIVLGFFTISKMNEMGCIAEQSRISLQMNGLLLNAKKFRESSVQGTSLARELVFGASVGKQSRMPC